jgi:transcriptional regulator GlxA family with amidase domain
MVGKMEPMRPAQRSRLSIGFVLVPNFTLLAFSGMVDTLRLSADEGDRSRQIACTWSVLSHNSNLIRSSCGVQLAPTATLDDPREFDYIVVVGGVLDGGSIHPAVREYLSRAAQCGVPLAAACTGTFVLASLGLMKERTSSVSWYHAQDFSLWYPTLSYNSDELFVVDQDRISCAGGSSAIHMTAFLVEKHCGAQVAAKALRIMMEGDCKSPVTLQPQPVCGTRVRDFRVRKAMLLMERTMANPVSTEFAAKHVGVGKRQLERLFQAEIGCTPSEFFVSLRLQKARALLQDSIESISQIALLCGFFSHSHFAASFRERYGHTPSQARTLAGSQQVVAISQAR